MAMLFNDGEKTFIISNDWSITQAGFHFVRSYYNRSGDSLSYYRHDNGMILEKISRRRHQPFIQFYDTPAEANAHFKYLNGHHKSFQDGKWVPQKR